MLWWEICNLTIGIQIPVQKIELMEVNLAQVWHSQYTEIFKIYRTILEQIQKIPHVDVL